MDNDEDLLILQNLFDSTEEIIVETFGQEKENVNPFAVDEDLLILQNLFDSTEEIIAETFGQEKENVNPFAVTKWPSILCVSFLV
jgi:hypothetical protein